MLLCLGKYCVRYFVPGKLHPESARELMRPCREAVQSRRLPSLAVVCYARHLRHHAMIAGLDRSFSGTALRIWSIPMQGPRAMDLRSRTPLLEGVTATTTSSTSRYRTSRGEYVQYLSKSPNRPANTVRRWISRNRGGYADKAPPFEKHVVCARARKWP